MEIIELPIKSIIPYKNNPRHNDKAVEFVANSLRQFGWKQPIVIDEKYEIVAGHTRWKAAKMLGMETVPYVMADDLTPEQVQAYRLADNKTAEMADWDFELLEKELNDIDMDMEQFGFDVPDDESNEVEHMSLIDRFVVPPFSVLDTRQGYWQDRKKTWKALGIKSEEGRSDNLTLAADKSDYMKTGCKGVAVQTSVFDPVLTEIMYNWFCPDGGKIYDCFAGGCVRGIVAEKLGYQYTGIDLRQEQVDANIKNAAELDVSPIWYCDDSCNADKYLANNSVDMIFSCPPYFDLEVYSDDPRDISNMDFDGFCKTYRKIIDIACKKLKENRFAVFVVGDIRDPKGYYRNFVDLTKKCFNDNGLQTYNEMILIEEVGTGAIRAKKQMMSMRKVIKTHQNVLCFFKGNPKAIKEEYGDVCIGDADLDDISEV